jgi:tRNA pseudouridine55 synthase
MDGILIIDKPVGLTSHDVVARLRRILKTKKIGHTGTLDPFATGVLVMLVGKATRLAQFLDKDEKEYEAVVRFGFETETGDRTGASRESRVVSGEPGEQESPTSQVPAPKSEDGSKFKVQGSKSVSSDPHFPSVAEVEEVLSLFRGEIEQVPPMYSAKKIEGKKLYELARKGIEVERKPVTVTITKLEIIEPQRRGDAEKERKGEEEKEGRTFEKERTTPALARHPSFDQRGEPGEGDSRLATHDSQSPTWDLGLRVACSAGTYIRTLAEDMARAAGSAAHLAELRRTRAGRFDLAGAVTLEELEKLENPSEILVPMNEAVSHLPEVQLTKEQLGKVRNGVKIPAGPVLTDLQTVRLTAGGELVAIGSYQEGMIRPRLVF